MLQFSKYQGLGNDFLIIEGRHGQLADSVLSPDPAWVQRICDRRFGVGGDGLILALPASGNAGEADLRMQIFNADGTEAEMCGNGIRCLARFLADSDGQSQNNSWSVETAAGVIRPRLLEDGRIEVDMGRPLLQAAEIPTSLEFGPAGLPQGEISIGKASLAVAAVGMGNPHMVVPVEDLAAIPFEQWGPTLEAHSSFPSRTNVHFLQVHNRKQLEIRVWERGSGPTLACGTGACATLVAAVLLGLSEDEAEVRLPGGSLQISWKDREASVLMTGPAVAVFDAVFTPAFTPLEQDVASNVQADPQLNDAIEASTDAEIRTEMPVDKPVSDPDQPTTKANKNPPVSDQSIDQSELQEPTNEAERKSLKKVQSFLSGTSLDSLLQLASDSLEKRTRERQEGDDRR